MAQENFLINPPKRLGRTKHRRNPIGETLVTIGMNPSRRNPWFGDSAGHRRAALIRWGKIRRKPVAKRKVKRKAVVRLGRRRRIDKRSKAYKLERKKQYSQLKGFLGLVSGKKRRYKRVAGTGLWGKRNPFGRSSMRHRRNSWLGQPRRHRKAAKKGWRIGHLVPVHHKRGARRRRIRHYNPMVGATSNPRRKRHYNVKHRRRHNRRSGRRHNPAIGAMFGKFTGGVMNVRHWMPLAVTGGLSAVTGAVVPGMLGVTNPWAKYGVQTAVAFGGGIVVEQVAGKEHGQAWMIVGIAMVGYSLLKEFVLQPYFPQFAVGLGATYQDFYPGSNQDDVSQRIDAFPSAMHAFPSAMHAYPGVGETGAYPYDGAGY